MKTHPLYLYIPKQIDAIILADGSFPTDKSVLNLLSKANNIICCDGAAESLIKFGLQPSFVIGDLDSISVYTKKLIGDKLIYRFDQETNDLTKAVHFCNDRAWKRVVIMGATGKREDHTLGNISLLADYAQVLEEVVMLGDYGLFIPFSITTIFPSFEGQQVSIFSLSPSCAVSVDGLVYPVNQRNLQSWWQGTLNESYGDTFTIKVHDEGNFVVFLSW